MPQLIKLYIKSVLIGFAISAALVATLLWLDIAHLRHLIGTAQNGLLALFLLWMFNGIIFSGVQFAIAIMGMAEDDDDEPRGGMRIPMLPRRVALVPVKATAKRRYHARNL